jgi:hypothetical protein
MRSTRPEPVYDYALLVLSVILLAIIWTPACSFDTDPLNPSRRDEVAGSVAVEVHTEPLSSKQMKRAHDYTFSIYGKTVDPDCRYLVNNIPVEYLPQADLRDMCGTTLNIGGCSYGDRTFIEDTLRTGIKTHVHEYMHVLLGCQEGDSDHDHRGSVWAQIELKLFREG